MAGVKGRSGSGGARPGAGRPRKPRPPEADVQPLSPAPSALTTGADQVESGSPAGRDMLQLLQDVALGRVQATSLQVRAAIAAVQYTHTKRGDGGKKDDQAAAAKKAAAGKYRAAPAPKLVVNNR